MLAYHDEEWGVPLRGDRDLFAKLVLDGFQAGLSWRVILHKRARFLEVFDRFDPERMVRFDRKRIAQILKDPGIVRNRQKVNSAIGNARAFLEFQETDGSFGAFLWNFVGGNPKQFSPPHAARSSRPLPGVGRDERGPHRAGLPLRGTDHLLRLHAGRRHGERPPRQLLPSPRGAAPQWVIRSRRSRPRRSAA